MSRDLMTTQQVADLHGVTRGRVVQWIQNGDLPAKKFNQVWMIYREDAENYSRKPIPGRPAKDEQVSVQN